MIKQKIIQLKPNEFFNNGFTRIYDFSGILTILKNKVIEFYNNNDINQETLDEFTNKFPFYKNDFYYITPDENGEIRKVLDNGILNSYISEKKDSNNKITSVLGLNPEDAPNRTEALSFYLQEFLDELNKINAEIISISPVQTQGGMNDGGASYTQGLIVVYKEL